MPDHYVSLFDPDDLRRIRQPLEQAWTLPPSAYTDPRVFAAEIEAIFASEWLCVARIDQLPEAGDYVCTDLPDQPIVVTRGRDEQLRAFSRVCLHRAMPIVEGQGNATGFVCPYHSWSYELDGQLRSAPMMDGAEGFDPQQCRLPELQLEVWQGFVFVNLNPNAKPLGPRLQGLSQRLQNYRFDQLVIAETIEFNSPWNWKILVENFMEAYHHIGTHRMTFEPVYPARDSVVEDNGCAPWSLLRMPGRNAFIENDALPALPDLSNAQQRDLIAITVFPTLLFGAIANCAAWYQLEPRAHDAMRLRIHILLRPEVCNALDADARAALAEQVRVIHLEDIPANAGPWRGLKAGKTKQGRLSPYEKAIWQLNQLWADRLQLP